jgi:Protein of unknown function (DUF3309)
MLSLVILIVLILLLFSALPRWGYHRRGYGPSGLVGVVLVIVLFLVLVQHRF